MQCDAIPKQSASTVHRLMMHVAAPQSSPSLLLVPHRHHPVPLISLSPSPASTPRPEGLPHTPSQTASWPPSSCARQLPTRPVTAAPLHCQAGSRGRRAAGSAPPSSNLPCARQQPTSEGRRPTGGRESGRERTAGKETESGGRRDAEEGRVTSAHSYCSEYLC